MANDLNYPRFYLYQDNAVNLYLQVETLAHMVNEEEDEIQASFKNIKKQFVSSWTTKTWPNQSAPTEKAWKTWSIFLHHIAPKKQLETKLG